MTFQWRFKDTLINFLSGLGVPGRDKAVSSFWSYTPLTQQDVETAYRSNWIARKLVDIPAYDATRAWRAWQTDTDKSEKLEDLESELKVSRHLRNALIMARLYGGSALILGVDRGRSSDELNIKEVKKGDFKFIVPVSRYALGTGPLITDVMSPNYGKPEYFTRNLTSSTASPLEYQIHPSRVIIMQGMGLPDPFSSGEIWGDSVLQVCLDAVQGATGVVQAVATLVQEAKIDVIKIPDLSQNLATQEYTNQLISRFQLANSAKSIINTLLLDKEEEWQRITADMNGLPEILKMFLLIASGAADIPATRMLGQSPVGLNATGDGDLRNYYDRINSEQTNVMSPALTVLDDVLIASCFGSRNPSIYYEWNSLWQITAEEKANIASIKAKTFQIDATVGLIDQEALRIGRQNQLIEDGFYPGLEEALEEQDQLGLESMVSPEEQEAMEEEAAAQMVAEQAALAPPKVEAEAKVKVPPKKPVNDVDFEDEEEVIDEEEFEEFEDANECHDPETGKFCGEGGGSSGGGSSGGEPKLSHESLKEQLGKPVAKEGHTYAYKRPGGKETISVNNTAKPATDTVLYRGTQNPKEFGSIKSVVVREAESIGGGLKLASSAREVVKYDLNIIGKTSTQRFSSLKSAMERAEFERKLSAPKKHKDENECHDPETGKFCGGSGGSSSSGGKPASQKVGTIPGFKPSTIKSRQVVSRIQTVDKKNFTGQPKPLSEATKPGKAETGDLAEKIILHYIEEEYGEARHAEPGKSNYPVDLVAGDYLIEAKGGLISNTKGAQQWASKIGGPGPTETALQKMMTREELFQHNEEKRERILERKYEVVEELSERFGRQLGAKTITAIIDTDLQLADIFEFDEFHRRSPGWTTADAKAAYRRTVRYEH